MWHLQGCSLRPHLLLTSMSRHSAGERTCKAGGGQLAGPVPTILIQPLQHSICGAEGPLWRGPSWQPDQRLLLLLLLLLLPCLGSGPHRGSLGISGGAWLAVFAISCGRASGQLRLLE